MSEEKVSQESTKETSNQDSSSVSAKLYPDQGKESGKKVEGEAVKEEAPQVEYKFDLGEDVHLEADYLEKIAQFSKEQGFSNEVANKIAQRENLLLSNYISKQEADHEKQVNDWAKQIENDKEFGGEKFKDNVNYAHQVINKFGDEDFKKSLNESGYGNHPGLFKVFAKIGQAMKNDELVHGQAHTSKAPKSAAELLYGKI